MSTDELLEALSLLLAGDSSTIHLWDESVERFIGFEGDGQHVRVALDGMDKVVCERFVGKIMINMLKHANLHKLCRQVHKDGDRCTQA